jgi:O-antigen/teichoic acid export membrane protein
MILRVSDRYMLTYLSANGLYDVGIYAIGYRIGMILVFLNSIVSLVYFPYAMKIADHPRAASSYRRMFEAYALWGGLLGFLIVTFAWEISLFLINSTYFEAVKVVVFGVISSFLHGLFNIINISFYIRKKASNIAAAVILGAGLNIVLNFLLIPRIGVYGAGIASVISYLFIFLLNFHISENLYPLNYQIKYVIVFLILMVIASGLNFLLRLIPLLTIVKITLLLLAVVWYYSLYLHRDLKKMSFAAFLTKKFRI